ncbi:MAG: hypothetical protein ABIN00_02820 [candidate division WOR-3 bacterium]
MKKFLLFTIIILAIIFYAETENEILQKIEKKYSSYSEIKSMQATYKSVFFSNDMKVPMTTYICVKDKKMKLDIIPDKSEIEDVEQMATTIINDGENIFLVNPIVGKVKLSEKEKENYIQDKGLLWWKQLSKEYKYLKDQENCYVFKKKSNNSLIFIDKKNLFLVKTIDYQNENQDTVVMVMSDYKQIDSKYYMPFLTTATLNGQKIMEMKAQKIDINVEIDDSVFEIKAGKEMDLNDLIKKYNK